MSEDLVDEALRKPRWTGEELQDAFRLRAELCTNVEIGEYLGRTPESVKVKLNREAKRRPKRRNRKWSAEERAALLELHQAQADPDLMAERLQRGTDAVRARLRIEGVKAPCVSRFRAVPRDQQRVFLRHKVIQRFRPIARRKGLSSVKALVVEILDGLADQTGLVERILEARK